MTNAKSKRWLGKLLEPISEHDWRWKSRDLRVALTLSRIDDSFWARAEIGSSLMITSGRRVSEPSARLSVELQLKNLGLAVTSLLDRSAHT